MENISLLIVPSATTMASFPPPQNPEHKNIDTQKRLLDKLNGHGDR